MSPWHVTPHVEDTLTMTPPRPPALRDMCRVPVSRPWWTPFCNPGLSHNAMWCWLTRLTTHQVDIVHGLPVLLPLHPRDVDQDVRLPKCVHAFLHYYLRE